MSSNSQRTSVKERAILERQRQLAAKLKPPKPPASSIGSSTSPPVPPCAKGESHRTSAPPPNVIDLTESPAFHQSESRSNSSRNFTSQSRPLPAKRKRVEPSRKASSTRPATDTGSQQAPPTKPESSSHHPVTVQKRPTLKRKGNLPPAAALMAAARVKAGANDPKKSVHATTIGSKSSPRLQRKTVSTRNANAASGSKTVTSGSLAQLVQNVSSTPLDAANLSGAASGVNAVHADDFWKHLREWDFVSQYASYQRSQRQQLDTNDQSTTMQKKPLPNVFLNARHYMAAWAPLCLAECRAQLLQEAGLNASAPLAVQVQTSTNEPRRFRGTGDMFNASSGWDEHDTGGYVTIQPQQRGTGRGMKFFPHDLVLLLIPPYEHILRDLSQSRKTPPAPPLGQDPNDPAAYKDVGLIGHVEMSRGEVAGLTLKISKRLWAKLSTRNGSAPRSSNASPTTTNMFLVKIGSNVTALREFTALCQVDTLPVQRYLLAEHLANAQNRRKLSRNQTTEQLLERMGGANALGKGFLDYAEHKFNASQLTAIAASAHEYGEGGFTLIKGPPGTGKTTTLVAVLNSLHIRQYNKYYESVRRIATQPTGTRQAALDMARRAKPRLLVCAPSNAAVDNIILKIMEDGFVDGRGQRYNPSMIRVGVGKGTAVKPVALETKVDAILAENMDAGRLETSIAGYRMELTRISQDIARLRRRVHAMTNASAWPLSNDWEIRIDEDTFDETGKVYFVNHRAHLTTYEAPPPPEPGETHFPATAMPEYRAFMSRIVKLVENYFSVKAELERCTIVKGSMDNGTNHIEVRQNMETHVLNSVHMVMTTLGTAGNRVMEAADKFEVVVVDEAAQSVEPATLSAFQLGSRHAVLVGDPQQLPATVFNISGRLSKYDRSLFQRLEEAGQPVYMLNEQYRMHPSISHFPRHIFYGGTLLDGPNVRKSDYGNPLLGMVTRTLPSFSPLMILDLDSKEERGGTSLSNSGEAQLAVYLYMRLKGISRGLSAETKVAVITPYAQQARMLREYFGDALGPNYEKFVEVNTVDAFQGREANIVIFSAVRAAGSHGIGFLSDVRRMNVALTRAKHFLFVIARCDSIVVNPYWSDLVTHARKTHAVLKVPIFGGGRALSFGELNEWQKETPKIIDNPPTGLTATEPRESKPIPPPPSRPPDPRKAPKAPPPPATPAANRVDPRKR
jgi:senataxin